jgi:hypothetical protein
LLALLCTVLLLPRLGDAHLHLCLDGSSPAIALHLSGGAADDSTAGAGESHHDHKVDVSSPVLGKVWPPSLDGALLPVVATLLVISSPGVLVPLLPAVPVPLAPQFLRPPLRGPPA